MLMRTNGNKKEHGMTQDRRTIKKTRMKLQKSAGSTALLRVMYIPLVVFMIRNVISIKGKITQNTHMVFYFAPIVAVVVLWIIAFSLHVAILVKYSSLSNMNRATYTLLIIGVFLSVPGIIGLLRTSAEQKELIKNEDNGIDEVSHVRTSDSSNNADDNDINNLI